MSLLKSKKFWVSISGVVAVIVSHLFGVGESAVLEVTGIVIALVLGQGLADLGKNATK